MVFARFNFTVALLVVASAAAAAKPLGLEDIFGVRWEEPEEYWSRSPLSLVGNVTTPTMLLTGESDLRTPMAETEQYYQALKLRGIDTAVVRIPGAVHSIATLPSQLMAKVAAILAWFEQYRDSGEGA